MDAIGTIVSASGRYMFSSASANVDYSKSTGYNSTSTFALAKAWVVNPIVRGANFQLTDTANNLLRASNLDGFRTAFGDSFVRAIKTGGEFFAVFRLTSLRETTQQSLAATLTAEINGFVAGGSFQGQFSNSHSDTTENSEVGCLPFVPSSIFCGQAP